MGASPCVCARALLQEPPSFADKLAALERWCDEHRPQEKMKQKTKIATDWDEEWKVGLWISTCRHKPQSVPEEHRAAFEAAVERSGYGQVRAAHRQRSVRGHTATCGGPGSLPGVCPRAHGRFSLCACTRAAAGGVIR